jgi:exopolyphosphatase/guanosine-5'-triphosphate,3'-diphosphate pyrophosphatase
MAYACVDVGSNTTRLLVADNDDGRLRELMTQRVYNELGDSLSDGARLPEEKLRRIASAVATQVRHARERGADRVAVVATAAIRQAANSDELGAAVLADAGLPMRVLTTEEEARLSFVGATKTLGAPADGTVAVVDVGGGSTEIATGTVAAGMQWSESFRVGSGSLTEAYVRSDPPAAAEVHALREHVLGTFEDLAVPPVEHAVAVGGSATSLRRLVGAELHHDMLERGIRILMTTPVDEVARRFELDSRRVRLLPAGILLLETISDTLGLPLTIGGGGLREGTIIEMIAAEGTEAA